MPRLEYFVVAESVATDQFRNTVSLFHVMEDLYGEFPMELPSLVAVSSWHVAADEMERDFQVALHVRLPDGRLLPDSEKFTVNFTAQRSRQRISQFIEGLSIAAPGDVEFELLLNGEHQASHTITFHAAEEAGSAVP